MNHESEKNSIDYLLNEWLAKFPFIHASQSFFHIKHKYFPYFIFFFLFIFFFINCEIIFKWPRSVHSAYRYKEKIVPILNIEFYKEKKNIHTHVSVYENLFKNFALRRYLKWSEFSFFSFDNFDPNPLHVRTLYSNDK